MTNGIIRPVGMELRVAINALAQYSILKDSTERTRLQALEYVDQLERRTSMERAAAEMYEVLKVFVEKYSNAPDGVLGVGLVNGDFFKAQRAIAKAEGKANDQG